MAIVRYDPRDLPEIPIPHEPGQWVKMIPLTVGMADDVQQLAAKGATKAALEAEILARVIVAWSYPYEISVDVLRDLDTATSTFLSTAVDPIALMRKDAEKKESSPASSRPPRGTARPTRPKSLTSPNANGSDVTE